MNFNSCMKKLITIGCFATATISLFLFGFGNVSCNKPTDCKANITVVDATNSAVTGATVLLYSSNPPGQVQSTSYTDGSGVASFNFKLPAIFDIHVIKMVPSPKDSLVGKGIIQLQVGQTVSTTVTAN